MNQVKKQVKTMNQILDVFKWNEFINYNEVLKRLNKKHNDNICRAWEDLTINGRLQEGQNKTYRINN